MYEGNIDDNRGFTKEAGIKVESQDLEADVLGNAAHNDDKITDEAVLDHCKASQIASDHTHSLSDGEFHRKRLVDLFWSEQVVELDPNWSVNERFF